MSYGFVYFLSNPSMPGIVKIGYTLKHPRDRMAELSASTSCPTPFEMLGFFDTEDPQGVEQAIHRSLDWCRVNGRREFFRAPLRTLESQLNSWGNPESGCFQIAKLKRNIANEVAPGLGRAAINVALEAARANQRAELERAHA
ncbi:hypothetical protein CR105_16050 [Massilia eurypsychrophila]|uniref:Bacteriophage T5 Orf172 DNA-binding domain-containing protein n=1 Tax=Massilia eurypsychrophila TaxID=1485217 RepID=A0A2G8TCZ8_9BURK|nr:GIY-YIG nuclease family protein [Massilia eurypsychrophila]PIL43864.1 hypothetical protein CR105_16050 [Massilia eurypsychrophila]